MGIVAPAEFVRDLESLANTHHEQAFLDVMRAYVGCLSFSLIEMEHQHVTDGQHFCHPVASAQLLLPADLECRKLCSTLVLAISWRWRW